MNLWSYVIYRKNSEYSENYFRKNEIFGVNRGNKYLLVSG